MKRKHAIVLCKWEHGILNMDRFYVDNRDEAIKLGHTHHKRYNCDVKVYEPEGTLIAQFLLEELLNTYA
jgi:hypothetical protein